MDWPRIFYGIQRASGCFDEDVRLERARRQIDARFFAPNPVEELARTACMSREHFIRSFRRAYGLPPHRYLVERRVLAARRLLEGTDRSVTDICLDVGFTSLGSFSQLFAKHCGHAPSHYRRRFWVAEGLARPVGIPACFAFRFGGVDPSLLEKCPPSGLC